MSDPRQLMARSQPLWQASVDGLVLVDSSGSILATNAAFDEMFGYREDALIGRSIDIVVPIDSRTDHARLRQRFEANPVPRPMAASPDLEGQRYDGSTFPVNISLAKLTTDSGTHTIATIRDLTERVQMETEAAKSKRQHAMALERERIAHDLHDTVIQRLFALGLTLEGLSPQAEGTELAHKLFAAVDTIDDIIDDLRSTIYGLRNRLGAGAPIRERVFAVIDEMEQSLGFVPTLILAGRIETLTDPALIDHLLAVIREALSNTARHADASEARVVIELVDGEVRLEVTDNGIGLKENVSRSGLANLADRAVALDGTFDVRRGSPNGTLLRWAVPAASDDHSGVTDR